MDAEAIHRHPLWGPSSPHRTLGESRTAATAFSSSLPRQHPRDGRLELLAVLSPATSTDPVLPGPAELIDPSKPETAILGKVRSAQWRDEIGLSLPASP